MARLAVCGAVMGVWVGELARLAVCGTVIGVWVGELARLAVCGTVMGVRAGSLHSYHGAPERKIRLKSEKPAIPRKTLHSPLIQLESSTTKMYT